MRAKKRTRLTTPDLVLLSLLAERPMHGYQANAELERRDIRDWAGISRPQVYYSLEKLTAVSLVRVIDGHDATLGPERRVFETTATGKQALRDTLAHSEWATGRDRPAFLTWIALSWQARPGVFEKQLERRTEFLRAELRREEATLRSIFEETGHTHHEAVWMVKLMIAQFRTELRWLATLSKEHRKRAPARHPAYAVAAPANTKLKKQPTQHP
jgi:DNA-binding PadR family transcriptional regulator